MMEGFNFVTCVTGLDRPNAGKDDDNKILKDINIGHNISRHPKFSWEVNIQNVVLRERIFKKKKGKVVPVLN
jgi:hypothetical protein